MYVRVDYSIRDAYSQYIHGTRLSSPALALARPASRSPAPAQRAGWEAGAFGTFEKARRARRVGTGTARTFARFAAGLSSHARPGAALMPSPPVRTGVPAASAGWASLRDLASFWMINKRPWETQAGLPL